MMKLILAIVASDAVDSVSKSLASKNYPVTHISSVGGFLRRGSTTLVIGVNEDQVQGVIDAIRAGTPTAPRADNAHAVTLFVVNAGQFIQV
jgi:uncharacterized protein YaaQ